MTLKIKGLIFVLVSSIIFSGSVQAEQSEKEIFDKFKQYRLNYKDIMGDYPKLGSPESIKDFATLYYWQKFRTEDQCAQAQKEVPVNLESFFGGILTAAEISSLKVFFYKHVINGGGQSTIAKFIFRRPRPYNTRKDLVPCIDKSNSYAYPSGHTTVARVLGLMLAKKFPDREKEFIERADQIAQNRIIGGVHHPSDIVAGKKLADKIVENLENTPAIMQEYNLL